MSRRNRRLILAALAALVALGVVWLLRPNTALVELGRVTRGPLEVAIEDEGQTRIHPRYVVAAPVAGRLAQIELDPGDLVAAGAVVASLAPAPLGAREREQAEARVESSRAAAREAQARAAEAEAAVAQAHSTLIRYRALFDSGQLAEEELDRARSEEVRLARALDAAHEGSAAARFEVAAARSALIDAGAGTTIVVRAPTAGTVLRLVEDSERVVAAGAPILELGDPANLEVVVEVLSTDAVTIPAGAPMTVDAGSGRRLAGRVLEVEPSGFTKVSPLGVEEQRVRVIGLLDQPATGVGDRFRIRARIVLWHGDDVLQVPSGAVFRTESGWAAYRFDQRRARLTPLEVGHRGADAVEVLSGLAIDDRLLLYPGDKIADGSRVKPIDER